MCVCVCVCVCVLLVFLFCLVYFRFFWNELISELQQLPKFMQAIVLVYVVRVCVSLFVVLY